MEDRKNVVQNNSNNIIQNLILENREKLTITGVVDVLSFDDQIVIVETQLGLLTIKGRRTVSRERTDTSRRTVSWERTDTSRRTDG